MRKIVASAAAAVLVALGGQDLPKGYSPAVLTHGRVPRNLTPGQNPGPGPLWGPESFLPIPRLERAPRIDGDLSDWKDFAFTDGVWDLARLRQAPWYDPAVCRLTIHPGEMGRPEDDLNSRYYMAWDDEYLYLGAEVHDNVNDTVDPQPEPKRWYFKDAVCWFIEAPRRPGSRQFGLGDNAFCFVIDSTYPADGAWWRHGDAERTYIEEPLPARAVTYALRMNPWGGKNGDFILEARIRMAEVFPKTDPDWRPPKIGDEYGIEIVHTDPDGGDYGGHFLIYGRGDDDATWGRMRLVGPLAPIERKSR
jgi:hypothetical protein